MTKKVLCALLFSTTFLLLGFYLLTPTPEDHLQKALALIEEKNISQAEYVIDDIEKKHPNFPLTLYRGYIAQLKGLYRYADHYFQKALAHTEEEHRGEIFLAQLANAYFEGKDKDIPLLIENARNYANSSATLQFFEGLEAYLQGNYPSALKYWKCLDSEDLNNEFTWSRVVNHHLFSKTWQELHVGHCLLEEGNIHLARETFEKEIHFLEDDHLELQELGTLFLGLTYLKEAEQVPSNERDSYYKIAHFYFERGRVSDSYQREKLKVISHLEKKAKQLMNSREFQGWGLHFAHLLQDWKADHALNTIASLIVERIFREPNEDSLMLCQTIAKDFYSEKLHALCAEKLTLGITDLLNKGETDNLFSLWNCLETVSLSPSQSASIVASFAADAIFKTLQKDHDALPKTVAFLKFWKHIEQDAGRHFFLARGLIAHAQLLWKKEGSERRGIQLMDLAVELASDHQKHELLRDVESFLTSLYNQAEECNMVARLSIIFDAFVHFGIASKNLIPTFKLDNYLADAQYLFNSRNFFSAQTHSEWVLKLDPKNEEALRLFGLSCYHLGEYSRALASLKQLSDLDEYSQKALILSKVFSSQDQERHIAQIDVPIIYDEE